MNEEYRFAAIERVNDRQDDELRDIRREVAAIKENQRIREERGNRMPQLVIMAISLAIAAATLLSSILPRLIP